MKVKVNKEKCLICGMCASMVSEVFNFNDEGFVEANNDNINDNNIEEVKTAMDNCPVGAIEEVEEEEEKDE